jgi:mono/diheme cytochrome c family protein
MKTIVATLSVAIILAVLTGLAVMYTGTFNVATSWKDPALLRWALVTTREKSIERRAESIVVAPMKGLRQIENGFRSYRDMCAICHAFPGMKASPVEKGLNPEPPELAEEAEHMSAAALFWVIKNGIRMTGMPAWGVTHEDDELWDIVAFIKAMPEMNDADYRRLDKQLAKGHGHGDNGDSHGDAHEH